MGLIAGQGMADTKKLQIDKNSPEGQYFELISLESDASKKIGLLEQFLVLFPTSAPTLAAWVYGELQDRYRRAGQLDKAIAAGEKILALEPDNLETARLNWRMAETKGDAALVKKWSAATATIAERVVKSSLPSDPEEMKAAEDRLAYARQFVVNTEHDDYKKAIETKDPAQRIAALEEFLKKSPQNPYLDQIEIAEFLAYKEIGDLEKTLSLGEKILAHNDTYENALLMIAEINFRRQKDPKRTLALATKFVERMAVATKPEGIADQDWTRTKTQNLALAHFIIGSIRIQNGEFAAADRALRAALPFVAEEQFRATVLNQLGWVNYHLENALEAIKYYRQCAAIRSPFQDQASKAILTIKSEYSIP
jgi:tetratricopeptide (TPR) repeat protein